MSKFYLLIVCLFQAFLISAQTCSTCTITLTGGTNVNVNLTSGKDVICITGAVNGLNVNNLGEGNDEICIQGTGSLTWNLPPINTGTLTIKVQPGGILTDNSSSYNGKVTIQTGGQIRFQNGLTLQGNPGNTFNILSGGLMTVTGNLQIAQGSAINLSGTATVSGMADISEGNFTIGSTASLSVATELYIHSDQFTSSGTITAGSLRFTNKSGDGPEFMASSSTTITGNIYIDAVVILNGYLETTNGSVEFTSNGRDNGAGGMLKVSSTSTVNNSTIGGGGYYQGTFWDADTNGGFKTTPGQPVTSALNGFDVLTILSPAQNLNNITVAISLPVELSSFDVKPRDGMALLSWETASENNNEGFEIYRSRNGTDFQYVARVDGSGSSTVRRVYTYADNNPVEGVSYYRLRQMDYDGKASWSQTRSVMMEIKIANHRIVPNPVRDYFMLEGLAEGEIVMIYNNNGTPVLRVHAQGNDKIDTSNLPQGLYTVVLPGKNETLKLIKE